MVSMPAQYYAHVNFNRKTLIFFKSSKGVKSEQKHMPVYRVTDAQSTVCIATKFNE